MRRSLALLLGLAAALLAIAPGRLTAQPPPGDALAKGRGAATAAAQPPPGDALTESRGAATAAPSPLAAAPAPGPTNPAAARPAVRLAVSTGGMQQVPLAALTAAGFDLASTDPAWLRLRSRGAEVPLELRGAGSSAELRFYAPEPGDHWNTADACWLTAEPPQQGWARIGTRDAAPVAGRETRGSARELGAWRAGERYDSTRPGPDGDHWFSAELRADTGAVSDPLAVAIATALPALGGPITVTVAGSTPAGAAPSQTLRATVGGATPQTSWPGGADWSHDLAFGSGGAQVILGAVAGAQPAALLVERVGWDVPVALDLASKGRASPAWPDSGTTSSRTRPPAGSSTT